jgi:hypothetical protein
VLLQGGGAAVLKEAIFSTFKALPLARTSPHHTTLYGLINRKVTPSVQFSKTNYSDGGETTAEVAAWDSDRKWVKLNEHDDVQGWCSPNEVLEIMNQIANK